MKLLLLLSAFLVCLSTVEMASPYDWMGRDNWDVYNSKFSAVNADNCPAKEEDDLLFPAETVSMAPKSNELLDSDTRVFRNRTCLLALHDIALSRSYFYSFLHKYLNGTKQFYSQPGWMYYYWRQASYVFGYPNCVNASSVFYDYNLSYPNWMTKVPINTTIELFGPRVYRLDNTRYTWMREPDMNSARAVDYGTGTSRNYTSPNYSPHPWYSKWLPDQTTGRDKNKGSFTVGLKLSNVSGKYTTDVFKGFSFFGPPLTSLGDDVNLPVKFTEPYFDCHGKAEWMVSAVAPIVDHTPRYRPWKDQVEFGETPPRFVGVVTVDTDWNTIDINPCPSGEGNPVSAFSGTARCKATTMCQPLTGWGFARGSYECVCRPGYRLPQERSGPFQGAEIELATEYEYNSGFECLEIGNMRVVPSVLNTGRDNNNFGLDQVQPAATTTTQSSISSGRKKRADSQNEAANEEVVKRDVDTAKLFKPVDVEAAINDAINADHEAPVKRSVKARHEMHFLDRKHDERVLREVYGPHYKKLHSAAKRQRRDATHSRLKTGFTNQASIDRMNLINEHITNVTQAPDCKKLSKSHLTLDGDVGYGSYEQFEYQGRTALALAHFLSGFYQSNQDAMRHGVVDGDKIPNPTQLHAEVLTSAMADHKIRGIGIFFEEDMYQEVVGNQLKTRTLFAPYAFQQDDQYRTVDLAGDPNIGFYLKEDWFLKTKMRWSTNTEGLEMFELRPYVRSNVDGTGKLSQTQIFPVEYYAAAYDEGQWTSPYFLCNGYVDDWVMSYVVPFFDRTEFTPLRFKGIVKVDVKLSFLDINQCSMPLYVPNAFKDTARCDYVSTYCVPVEGKRFSRGAYRCECKQGFEYPFVENAWFFDGQQLESEYDKMLNGETNKFDQMKCRTAGASGLSSVWSLMVLSLTFVYYPSL